MKLDLVTYPDPEMMALSLADRIAGELRQTLEIEGRASLAVPGGSTPGPMLRALAGLSLDWSRVTVVPTDERWVPRDHPRSNGRMLRQTLLQDAAAAARFFDLYTGDPTPEGAGPALSAALAPHLPLSVLVVGMGADGHVASLFPGAEGLPDLLSSNAAPVMAAKGGGEPRVTLTLPTLCSALRIHLLIVGSDKREALERAAGADPVDHPVSALLGEAVVHYAE